MNTPPDLAKRNREELERLLGYLKPASNDPTHLVLKAHLLAEEVLYRFVEGKTNRPEALREARLGFAQLVALSRALHLYSNEDWWGWSALKKLNSLRNLLAHNLEPKDLQDKVVDFSVFVAESIGATADTELGSEYERHAMAGTHPFLLALVALHSCVCVTLEFDPREHWRALQ